jgi:hypothetical protein
MTKFDLNGNQYVSIIKVTTHKVYGLNTKTYFGFFFFKTKK